MSSMIIGRTSFNISWTTIEVLVRKSVSIGLDEREHIEKKFRGEPVEAFHEYLKKIGMGTKEDCDRLKNFANGGDLDAETIAEWQSYHDLPWADKTDTMLEILHGGEWGNRWIKRISGKIQASPQIAVVNHYLVSGQSLPIELIEEVRARIKGRKEMYGWADLCSSDDCLQLMIDGDKWCALIGPNVQEGWAGFGDTRTEAVVNMYKSMLNG